MIADLLPPDLEFLPRYVAALAIGLLMGLERERNPAAKAGLRTFALTALFGVLAAHLAERTGSTWLIAAGLLLAGGMIIAAYLRQPVESGDPGTTTVSAVLVCYGLGVLCWLNELQLAAMLGIGSTVLLYFKAELRGISQTLTRRDLISILQFAVLSLIVLPLLPNQGFGPYGALNPHQIWWMVVLISGISLAGYAALRIVGQNRGTVLIGLLGYPLLMILSERSDTVRGAFWMGWLAGFAYFFVGCWWVAEAFFVNPEQAWMAPFAASLLPAGLGLFWGAACALYRRFAPLGAVRVLLFAALFCAAEWLRGHVLTGFPWNTFGYALTQPLVLALSVSLIGIWSLTFIAVAVFASPALFADDRVDTPHPIRAPLIGLLSSRAPRRDDRCRTRRPRPRRTCRAVAAPPRRACRSGRCRSSRARDRSDGSRWP